MNNRIAVIIVNLNLKDDTTECINSLLDAGSNIKDIFVIDNGSIDDSISYLRSRFGALLNIIEVGYNRGYAHGLNIGIKIALDQKYDWMLLLNNDTIVAKDFFINIDSAISIAPGFSLFGPMILYYDNPNIIWYLGERVIPGTLITRNHYRGKSINQNWQPLIPVDFIHGAGMLVKKEVFINTGYLNDISLIYGEEIEFCWKAKLSGFKAAAIPNAKMWHKISRFMSCQKPKTRYLRIRNQIRFYRTYSHGIQRIIMFFFTLCRCIYFYFLDIYKGNFDLLFPTTKGWIDGWRGIYSSDDP